MALLGYLATLLLLIAGVVAFQTGALRDLGWHGGQYLEAFLGVTVGAILTGAVLRARRPGSPWRSFGFGMILGGVTGGVMIAVIVALVAAALSHASFTF